jgi:hypothetical protein
MKASGQGHAPVALSQGKSLPVTIRWRDEGAEEVSEMPYTDGQTDKQGNCTFLVQAGLQLIRRPDVHIYI